MERILFRLSVLTVATVLLSACDTLFPDSSPEWEDFGTVPASASTESSHRPMVVVDDTVIVGTSDGLWQRDLSSSDGWERLGLEGVRILALRRGPGEGELLAAGESALDPDASPFYRSDDAGETWTASTSWPRITAEDNATATFYDIAIASDNALRLYANLAGQSIAVSSDGGETWVLANDETEIDSGDPCILYISPSDPTRLFQGCEVSEGSASDTSWIASYDIDALDPFSLTNLTYVAGSPDDDALGGRRPDSLVSGTARPDTLYAGLEGALIAIDDEGFEILLEVNDGDDFPNAAIRAIWLNPNDDEHLIFGGGVAGVNSELSLFETRDHGSEIEQFEAPRSLNDPVVEQIDALGDDDLAVLISEQEGEARSLRLFTLDPNDNIF